MRIEKNIVIQNAREALDRISEWGDGDSDPDLFKEVLMWKELFQGLIDGLEKKDYDSTDTRLIADAFMHICYVRVERLDNISESISNESLSILYGSLALVIMQIDIGCQRDDSLYQSLRTLSDEEIDEYLWEHSAYRTMKRDYIISSEYECCEHGARLLEGMLGELPEFDGFLRG